jgi:DNA-binding phage protein
VSKRRAGSTPVTRTLRDFSAFSASIPREKVAIQACAYIIGDMEMPTLNSQSILDEISNLINAACERGDSVSAIAERAGVRREIVSLLKNRSYSFSPTIEKVDAICKAVGKKICFVNDK